MLITHTGYLQRTLKVAEAANLNLNGQVAAANQRAIDAETKKPAGGEEALGMLRKMAKANAARNPDVVPVLVEFVKRFPA